MNAITKLNLALGLDPKVEFLQVGTPTEKQKRYFPDTLANLRYSVKRNGKWKQVFGNFRATKENGAISYKWHCWHGEASIEEIGKLLTLVQEAKRRSLLLNHFYKVEKGEKRQLVHAWREAMREVYGPKQGELEF